MLTLETFSERLNIAIKKSGMTQAALAEKAGTSAANISNYCRGKSFPPLDTLEKIAMVLNVSLDWLCGIEAEKPSASVKNLGDIARLLASVAEWECIELKEIEVETSELAFRGYTADYEEEYIKVKSNEPAMIFKSEQLRIFLEDLIKMKKLLSEKTFDYSFYNRWLEDRFNTLSEFPVTTNENGMYLEPMDFSNLPF